MSINFFDATLNVKRNFYRLLYQGHFTHGTFDEIVDKLRPLLSALPHKDAKEISKELAKKDAQIDKSKLLCFLNDLQAGKYSPFLTYDLKESRIRNRVAIDDQIEEVKGLQKQRFQELKTRGFSSFQRIKAGGDCYYRAIMKGYIEQSIMEAPEKRTFFFNRLANLFEGEVLAKPPINIDVERPQILALIANLRAAANGEKWTSLQDFWKDLADENTGTDHFLILSSRYLVAQAYKNNSDKLEGLLALEQQLIEDIPKMGQYTEGHPSVSLLPKVLAFPCDIIGIDNESFSVQYTDAPFIPVEDAKYPISYQFSHQKSYHLVFNYKDSHYDAIIHQKLEEKMQTSETSAEEKMQTSETSASDPDFEKKMLHSTLHPEENQCCFFLFFIYAWEFLKWMINCLTGNNAPTNENATTQPLI
jgi:hypothetical protein